LKNDIISGQNFAYDITYDVINSELIFYKVWVIIYPHTKFKQSTVFLEVR